MAFEADGSKVPISGVRCPIMLVCRPYGLRGRWEQGARLCWFADLMAFEAEVSKVPISGVRCPIMLVCRPYGLRGRWEQGAHLGSKVPDYVADLMAFEADGGKVPISGVLDTWRAELHAFEVLQNLPTGRSFRRTWLGVRPRAVVGHFAGEQSQHYEEISLLEALGQGRVNLLLYGSAARGKGPLPVDPYALIPDLRVDEGGEKLFGYGLIGADEPSKAAGILHLVNGLLLGLLRLLGSTFGLGEGFLCLLSPVLGGREFLLQLLDPPFSRGDLLLERHDLLLPDTFQGPSQTEEVGRRVSELKGRRGSDTYVRQEALVKLGRLGTTGAFGALQGENFLDLDLLAFFLSSPTWSMSDREIGGCAST
nr:hypothetical protein Iba_chr09fCG9320 [Ipomoea batatas]